MKRLLRDPLLHFALIGLALFAVIRGTGGDRDAEGAIRMSIADQALLQARW